MADTVEAPMGSTIGALIRTHIEAHKTRIYREINSYPMPIPACDAQYNYLLEERGRINQELKQLDTLSRNSRNTTDPGGALREFIDTSEYIHHALRQELSALLGTGVSP